MHMADALLAPAVAATMYAASATAAGVSIHKLKKDDEPSKLPVMAVTSALVFAGQMINYTIPGTGSSGHMCGGMMLSALLGPYAGFLSMIVILAIQCLFFADGGLMALGANCWNMAFYGCFVGYFLIWRPIMNGKWFGEGKSAERGRIIAASIIGCIITLQLGAFSVVLETSLSGITELPFGAFCAVCREYGYEIYDMDLLQAGEEAYAAMRRSTNGGGENSPLLSEEDDYYEMFFADL